MFACFRRLTVAAAMMACAVSAFAGLTDAAELTIGRGNEPQSIDPQFSRTGPNQMTAIHFFDRLILTDKNVRSQPGLAVSWRTLDPNTWEFKLRQGVKFHDGSPFTADDVIFSFERAPNVPNSPASFAQALSSVDKIEKVDDFTLRLTTTTPDPLLINNLGTIYIVSKKATENATSADFNSGKAAIGTGPYKFVEWVPADRLVMIRNDDYWGPKPAYEKVTMRFISNSAARVAALLSDSVDLIDLVPPADLPKLREDPNVNLFGTATVRLVYLGLNQREKAPFVTDLNGQPLDKNPFLDPKVRKAISMMIDRKGLVDRILYGSGEPAGQIVPEGVFGYAPDVTPDPYDPAAARKLLAEAGYPEGFGITIHSSNDRFLQDREIAQAIGQLLARGGLKVNKVETMPYSVYTKDAGKGAFGAFLFSYGNSTGEASRGLASVLHTYDKEAKLGTLNRFRYSDPKFDAAIEAAAGEFDDAKRETLLGEAAKIAFTDDTALVPLYFQSLDWAARKGIDFEARRDERTLAMGARPAN